MGPVAHHAWLGGLIAMSAEAFALVRTITVGDRLSVTFSIPHGDDGQVVSALVEWAATYDAPITPAELAEFQAKRHALLTELAVSTGQGIERVPIGTPSASRSVAQQLHAIADSVPAGSIH